MTKHYLLQFFGYKHLPESLQGHSKLFYDLAKKIIKSTPQNAEQTACLRKLLESKDCAVRSMIFKNEYETLFNGEPNER